MSGHTGSRARPAGLCINCRQPITDSEFLRDTKGDKHILCPPQAEEKKGVLCPGCGEQATTQHLRDHPACMKAAASFAGIFSVSKRKTVGKSTGRPISPRPCPRCGAQVSATEARYGHYGCSVVKSNHNGGVKTS